jgi:thioredoxin reductase (NADPH)
MTQEIYDMAVIGGGGAGTMAYLRGVLNNNRVALFTGDADSKRKGRATWVMEVDNMPGMHGLKRPITKTSSETLKWLKAQDTLGEQGTVFKSKVTSLQRDGDHFVLVHESRKGSETLLARHVVIATGIMDVQPQINGSIEPILPFANRGEAIYCVRCDGHQTLGQTVSIVGRSDGAIHIASMLMDRYGHESFPVLTNGPGASFSDKAMETAQLYGIEIHEGPIQAVLGDDDSGLQGFDLEGGTRIESTRTIIALGIIAYNKLLTGLGGEVDDTGKAIVDESFETSVPDVFVVGDLVAGKKMQIYTAWDEAVDAADQIDRRVRARKREVRRAAQTS